MDWKRTPQKKRGIICAADEEQEWLLPWWWSRYSQHNNYPVTFFDFGMTEGMRRWCAERGEVIPIDFDPVCVATRGAVDQKLAQRWEEIWGWRVWSARRSWFKKPLAFLESPYEVSIWIDIDCEILGPIDKLFKGFDPSSELALVRDYDCDHLPRLHPDVRYTGGVLVFKHGCRILQSLAERAVTDNHLFGGDDHLLSHLIYTHQLEVQELPEEYNWRMARGMNLDAVIIHWLGSGGKTYIREYGGLKPSLDAFYHSCKGITQ